MSIAIKHFDILEFVNKAKAAGVDPEFAEYQARQIEQVIDIAVAQAKEELKVDELVTKTDLKKEIAEAKNQIILWVAGLFVASGLIQHFFK